MKSENHRGLAWESECPRTALVIPCYNEADRVDIEAFLDALRCFPWVSLVFVDDGSTDSTPMLLEQIRSRAPLDRVEVMLLCPNQGKAEAVRRGLIHARFHREADYYGFWDADLSTPLADLPYFYWFSLSLCDRPDILLGSRVRRMGSSISRNVLRHYLGRVFATGASLVLRLPVYDTQCGAKLFSASCVADLVHEPFISRWIFDVELLSRYLRRHRHQLDHHERIIEVPLPHWRDVGGSKLRARAFLVAAIELCRIWRSLRRGD
jgi:glycosyltransferase involved in cell wall biosynthesis